MPTAPNFKSLGLTLKAVPKKPGWFRGPAIDWQEGKELAARVRSSPAASKSLVIVGLRDGDPGHRIYVTPEVSVRELVEEFRVGEHSDYDPEETIERVADRLEAVEKICPFVVTFADAAGLHADFTRKLTKAVVRKIEAVFPMEDAMQDGLDGYISSAGADESILLPRLLEEQSLHLWWD